MLPVKHCHTLCSGRCLCTTAEQVWLELLLPLDSHLASHPVFNAPNGSSGGKQPQHPARPQALLPTLLDFLLNHPASKGCFRLVSQQRGSSGAGEPAGASEDAPAASPHNSIAAAAAAPRADQGQVVALVVENMAHPHSHAQQQQQQQQQQRAQGGLYALDVLAELLPAWDRLRCSPAKVPFAGERCEEAGCGQLCGGVHKPLTCVWVEGSVCGLILKEQSRNGFLLP